MIDVITGSESRIWLVYRLGFEIIGNEQVWFEAFEHCADDAVVTRSINQKIADGEMFPTWLDYEVDGLDLSTLLQIEGGDANWLLQQGICPNQPFLALFSNYQVHGPDHEGCYDAEWETDVIAHGPPPKDIAGAIERAWGLLERLDPESP